MLRNTTLNIGRKYFLGADCPTKGITVGLGQLLDAEKVILIASGEKRPVL
jgi:6-phosphogluconolactonase/glucosamine-6-phosphate isomerase/deaminase